MRSNSTDKEIRNFRIHSYYDNDNDNDSDNRDLNLLFDGRPSDDDERLKLDQAGREKRFSLLNFFRSKRDKIFNWFQSARNYINSLFSSSSNSSALINVRSDRGLNSENKNSEKLVSARNSADFSDVYREYDHDLDEYESRIIKEDISVGEEYLNDFNKFKLFYQKYKNNEITSIDNFKTEGAKSYASALLQKADEKIKSDPNYFFKNTSEYEDVVVASILLGKKNKFEPSLPTKSQEENFKIWRDLKDTEKFSKSMGGSFKVDFEQAKIYADWIVFKSAIGEPVDGVDESVLAHATDLKQMMVDAEFKGKLQSLNQSVALFKKDMEEFFSEKNTEKEKSFFVKGDEVKEVDKLSNFPELNRETINLLWTSIAPEMNSKEFNVLLIRSGSFFDGLNNPHDEIDSLLESGSYALTFANLWSKALNDPKKVEVFQSEECFSHLKHLLDLGTIEATLVRLGHSSSRSPVKAPASVMPSEKQSDAPRNSEIFSNPPPPPPPRRKATRDVAATNAAGLTDIAPSAPPPAPPPRVRKS